MQVLLNEDQVMIIAGGGRLFPAGARAPGVYSKNASENQISSRV